MVSCHSSDLKLPVQREISAGKLPNLAGIWHLVKWQAMKLIWIANTDTLFALIQMLTFFQPISSNAANYTTASLHFYHWKSPTRSKSVLFFGLAQNDMRNTQLVHCKSSYSERYYWSIEKKPLTYESHIKCGSQWCILWKRKSRYYTINH